MSTLASCNVRCSPAARQRVQAYAPSRNVVVRPRTCQTAAAAANNGPSGPTFGMFVASGSPAIAEALSHSGIDWLCLDMQHGPVGYTELAGLLQATASGRARTIVRVGGPSDRFGIQQALDQGAGGVMVPLVNSVAEAREAVSYCRFPPEGCRSLVAPSRALLTQEGFGGAAMSRFLATANKKVKIWLQVESAECLESLDDILTSVPGIDCIFLGPADMAASMGLVATGGAGGSGRDLAAVLSGPEIAAVHERVLQACRRHGVAAGCFCQGFGAARQLAAKGYSVIAFDVDTNLVITSAAAAMGQLRRP